MKLEHVAFNISLPHTAADWYVQNLGMSIARKKEVAPYTVFIADDSGKILVEFYNNPPDRVPDYAAMDPLLLHLAFASDDPPHDRDRLVAAGATYVEEQFPEPGTHLIMLRDPWGLPVQLCKRNVPMLKP